MEDWFSFVWILFKRYICTHKESRQKSISLWEKQATKATEAKAPPSFYRPQEKHIFVFCTAPAVFHQPQYEHSAYGTWYYTESWNASFNMNQFSMAHHAHAVSQESRYTALLLDNCGWVSPRSCGHVWFLHLEYWNYSHACVSCQPSHTIPRRHIYMVGRKHLWGHRWYWCIVPTANWLSI